MVLNAKCKDASNVSSKPSEGVRVVLLNEAEGRVDPSEGRCFEIGITKHRCSNAVKIPVRGPAPDRVHESPADEIACTKNQAAKRQRAGRFGRGGLTDGA
jgi:hypothetical protein